MKRDGSASPARVTELFVRTALPNFGKAERYENGDDLIRLEDWDIPHQSGDCHVLNAYEFGLQGWFAIFEKHCEYLLEVSVEFVERLALGVRAREPRDKANKQLRLRAPLDHC